MKSEDAFEKGLYWAFFQYLEDDLIEYMRNVPYIDEHKHVHSPALLAQLLLNCSYIDTAFKDMARYSGFVAEKDCIRIVKARRKYNIGYAHNAYEPIYKLSAKKVIAKLAWCGDLEITPFEEFDKHDFVPKWWTAYNKSKHNWTKAFTQANLSNALTSLAGAFLLNAIHFPSIKLLHSIGRYEFGSWQKIGFVGTDMPKATADQILDKACKAHHTPDTICDLRPNSSFTLTELLDHSVLLRVHGLSALLFLLWIKERERFPKCFARIYEPCRRLIKSLAHKKCVTLR